MPNSKNWDKKKAGQYYEDNKERIRIQKRRKYKDDLLELSKEKKKSKSKGK